MEEKKDNKREAGAASRREAQLARLRKRHPEKKFEDEEEIFGQISDDYDAYEAENGAMKEREKAFSDLFTSNPKSARLMMEWKDGKDPVASLIRIYGKEDILGAIEDPERLEAIEAANREFAAKVAKSEEYEREYEKNFPASVDAVEKWMAAQGVDEESVDKAVATLSRICGDFITGKFTPATIEMIMKAESHDTDVAAAREEGEVAGKNARIVEKLRERQKGDGLQNLGGSNNAGGTRGPRGRKSMFDWAQEAT